MRAVDEDEVEAPVLGSQVEEDASGVADALAHTHRIDESDVSVEAVFQSGDGSVESAVLDAPGERIDAGDRGVRKPPEDEARRQSLERPDLEHSRRTSVERAKERLPRMRALF